MPLLVLRCLFVIVAVGLGASLLNDDSLSQEPWAPWAILGGSALLASAVVALDVLFPNKKLDIISSVYFGVIVGLFLSYVTGLAIQHVPMAEVYRTGLSLTLTLVFCYICTSLLIQTRNDFRFIIPYVEFAKEVKGRKPYVLDTSVIIDGRIADVVAAGLLDSQLIMPRFVLAELQGIADSSDRLRRGRGRRGLDVLNRLKANDKVDLVMYDRDLPEFANQPVDLKLVMLAKHLDGKIVTNDYNLNKVAQVQGVQVVNLNDLSNALKPVFLPGEQLDVRIVKPGEEAGQGVGYLEDGTMVVVESGREHVNQTVHISVTSVLQTSAGRMIFGRYESPVSSRAS